MILNNVGELCCAVLCCVDTKEAVGASWQLTIETVLYSVTHHHQRHPSEGTALTAKPTLNMQFVQHYRGQSVGSAGY